MHDVETIIVNVKGNLYSTLPSSYNANCAMHASILQT